jgi:hypothetical protein
MSAESLLTLCDRLREDPFRSDRPFTQDIEEAHRVIHHPFAYADEVAEALAEWCKKRQPCQFGKIAATRGQIHFCILRDRDLADGDQAVAETIAAEKRLWKQRAVSDRDRPPHGFLLVLASPRVALAAPDDALRRLADRLLELSGWAPKRRGRKADQISSDFLYLRHPTEATHYGFQFNIDFFAAAGDGRWWHDHRIPGGIAFTANSTGHMRSFLEWYRAPGVDHGDWALKQAMITIANAHPTALDGGGASARMTGGNPQEEGRVTWLLDLDTEGRPVLADVPCPLKTVPPSLQGKDWTRYAGLLHTDHAVRPEFFADREEAITRAKPYLLDLAYLHDRTQTEFAHFSSGVPIASEILYAEIGPPVTWMHRSLDLEPLPPRPAEQVTEIANALRACRHWKEIGMAGDADFPDP